MQQALPINFIQYLRVSSAQQGRSGLGLEAQREDLRRYANANGGKLAQEYVEVESGKLNDRPKLQAALKRCRLTGSTLVVAKLDRLSRNAAFLMTLRDSGVNFVAADLPTMNTMTVGIMAVVAQYEREAIAARTKAALAAAKRRGVKLGGLRKRAPDIAQFQESAVVAIKAKAREAAEERRDDIEALLSECLSLSAMAERLNASGIQTPRGLKGAWTATAVRRCMIRLKLKRAKLVRAA